MSERLNLNELEKAFVETLAGLQEESEFVRGDGKRHYASDEDGCPQIKLALGNVQVGYDLWEGLRNPATVGLHPAGLPEIWEFHANRRKQKTDESGRQSIFQTPRGFEYALNNYRRAVIVSVMLPFSREVVHEYVERVIENKRGSSHLFAKMYEDTNRMLDKAVARVAIELASADAEDVVVAMNNDTVKAVSTEAIPQTRQGISHGPSKGGNYSQKSVAVLVGLGQFGVSRIVFRDEVTKGKVQRCAGPIRSIIVFDKTPPVTDGRGGVMYPTPAWREFLLRLFDFGEADSAIDRFRFCTYLSENDGGCRRCVESCPSGAQIASAPLQTGGFSEQLARQTHRFWKGKLQFDFNRCQDERGQLSGLYPEWSCARCVNVCLDRGVRRKTSVADFYARAAELTAGEPAVSAVQGQA